MIEKLVKEIPLAILTVLLVIVFAAPSRSEAPSKATTPSASLQLQDIQTAADRINKKLDSYGPYLSVLDEVARDPGINTANMLLYYDKAFFQEKSYKKLIIFYFGADKTFVDEFYPIRNNKYTYVIRQKLNTTLKRDQLNIESFLHEYERMKKTVLSRFVFTDGRLVLWTGQSTEAKTNPDYRLVEEGQILLERERIAVDSVVMD